MSSPSTTPFQVAPLLNSPSYPNVVVWSDDNLIAVANGDIITILNPDNLQGPQGVINVVAGKPFPVGFIDRADLSSGCLLPTCLARDRQPCVRSLSWSPVGYTPGNGCLLAVCSTEGRVKVYREPVCEFQAEWIEDSAGQPLGEDADAVDSSIFTFSMENKRKRVDDDNLGDSSNDLQLIPAANRKRTSNKWTLNRHTDNVLKAHQYASRSRMMASLVVAWSPVLQFPANDPDYPCDSFCLLAVGTKSGTISIWRFNRSSHFSVEHHDDPISMSLVGFFDAHSSWVTALSWGLLASDSSPQVLLAAGCSDGSAKILMAHVCDFKRSFEANETPFSSFSEIAVGDNALVSTLSLCIPAQSPQKILVAIGTGSGSFEVWTINIKTKSPKKVGSYYGHVYAVTGLAWAFDGHCLYSCSQDNSIHGWIHHKGALFEASIPANNLGTRSSCDLPSVSDSSYGVAVSPANLALAVRAAVEFFWIGGQELNLSQRFNITFDIGRYPGFTKDELVTWGSKLLWSLNQYESCDKHLVAWDVLVAMLAFKQCSPQFAKHVILRWLELLLEGYIDSSTDDILSDLPCYMSQVSSRQLHLINILCRRVMVSSGSKIGKIPAKLPNLAESCDMEEKQKWLNVLSNSENELRQRLVGLSLSTVLSRLSHPAPRVDSGLWNPIGIGQIVKWVLQNQGHVHHKLNLLATEVKQNAARILYRLHNVRDYMTEEQCSYCSAYVPFESPEVALCEGIQYNDGESPQKHTLARCLVSMKVCPPKPLWFCVCCQRRASNLPPNHLHNMVVRPADFVSYMEPLVSPLPLPLPERL